MLRLLAISILLACVPALLPAAPVPPAADKPVYHFPTRVGTRWVYSATCKGDEYGEVVTHSEVKDGRFLVTVKTTSVDFVDHDSTTITQYAVSKDGVFEVAGGLESEDSKQTYDVPYCELKLPHKDGNTWRNNTHKPIRVLVARKVETVKVPAGTFEAICVEIGDQKEDKIVIWYAPSVGIVKRDYNDIHLEMKSFELPKK